MCFRVVHLPASPRGLLLKRGRGIDRKWNFCKLQHRQIVDAIPENGIRMSESYTAQGCCLALVAWDIEQCAGCETILDGDAGCKHALWRNVQGAHALLNHPVRRGRHGPKLRPGGLQLAHKLHYVREEVWLNVLNEVLPRAVAEEVFAKTAIDLDHLAADGDLVHLAPVIPGVALKNVIRPCTRKQAGLDAPVHEAGAGIPGPEGAVKIEHSGPGLKGTNGLEELAGGDGNRRGGRIRHGPIIAVPMWWRQADLVTACETLWSPLHLSHCTPFTRAMVAEEGLTMAGQFVIEVNDADFEQQVLESDQPVLVDFWAAWCGPCRALAPVVDQVAAQYNGQLKVMKMDVDRNNATAGRYGIRGIPALLLFKDGKVADTIVGYVPKDTIDKTVAKVLTAQSV